MALPLISLPFLPIDAQESTEKKLAYGESVLIINGEVFSNIFVFPGNEKTITVPSFSIEALKALRVLLTHPERIANVNFLLKALSAAAQLGLQDLSSLRRQASKVAITQPRESQALNWILRHNGGCRPVAPLFRLSDYQWLKERNYCRDVPEESLFSSKLTPTHLQSWATELQALHPVIAEMNKLLDRQNYIAGGALIEAAIASGLLRRKAKKDVDTEKYDIDIFCKYPADNFVRELIKLLDDHQPYAFCRNSGVLILTRDLPTIQITTVVNNDFDRVVGDFDLSCCQIGFYDKEIQMTQAAFRVIEDGWQETLRRPVAAHRVIKYQGRGIKLEARDAELITPAFQQEYFEWQADSCGLLKKLKAYHSDFKALSYPLACPMEDWIKDYSESSSTHDRANLVHHKDAKVWSPVSTYTMHDRHRINYLKTDDASQFTVVASIKKGDRGGLQITDSEVARELQERSEAMMERYLSCKGTNVEGQEPNLNALSFSKFRPHVIDDKTIDETRKYTLVLQHHVSHNYYGKKGKSNAGGINFQYHCLSAIPL